MADRIPSVLTTYQPGDRDASEADRFDNIATLRIVAYLIDAAIVAVLLACAFAVGLVLTVLTLGLLAPILGFLSFAVVLVGYSSFLVGGSKSSTFGMRMMGIEVRTVEGRRPDFIRAAVHVVLFYVLHVPFFFLLLLVGLFNPQRRLVHDFLTGLLLVRTRP